MENTEIPGKTGLPGTGRPGSFGEVLRVFTKLGLTSFGGPTAHLGFYREEIVERRGWVDERAFADLVGLCQSLPGPASSQVGFALGLARAGIPGGFAAWLGFTLPSALILVLFALGLPALQAALGAGWLHGLQVAAVAVVARAIWGMAGNLCPDRARGTIALLAAMTLLASQSATAQIIVILGGAVLGGLFLPAGEKTPSTPLGLAISKKVAVACLVSFFILLAGLPLLAKAFDSPALALFDSFYRAGSLVFGGGHVVLPLIQAEVVPPGWVTGQQFMAGYGAAQAMPGPLFTFSAYLGAVMSAPPGGAITGAAIALVAVFLPSWLLVIGALPFWDTFRARPEVQSALRGLGAAVVGLLLAALYQPVWTSAIHRPADFALGLAAFGLLTLWKCPPWLVVILAAGAGYWVG
jgi:chromate transporter